MTNVKGTPEIEIPKQLRDYTSRSLDESRKAFEQFMKSAREAAGHVEGGSGAVQNTATDMNRALLTITEQNISASMEYAARIAQARTLQELMALQTEYFQSRMTAMADQARELGTQAMKSASDLTNMMMRPR